MPSVIEFSAPSLPDSYVEVLMANGKVFEDGAIGRLLGLEEIAR